MYNIYINYNKEKEIVYIGVTTLDRKSFVAKQKEEGFDNYVEFTESHRDWNEAMKRKNYMVEFYRPKNMIKKSRKSGVRVDDRKNTRREF